MIEQKKKLRQAMKAKLKSIQDEERFQLAADISQQLFATDEWKQAHVIAVTISVAPEVPTNLIIEEAWLVGKKVAVPKCNPEDKTMIFKEITTFLQLESIYSGLHEPTEDTKLVKREEMDIIIVPGLAFTKDGYRLGFGGGYYDRFLSEFNGETFALAYEFQLMDSLPIEVHDIPVKKIVTPNQIYSTYSH